MSNQLEAVDRVLKALADPTRARLVGLLTGGEVCVCHLHETLEIPQSKASRHLAYLRRAGLVATEKRGLWVYYRLSAPEAGPARVLFDAACHCIGHLDVARADAKVLERTTGCAVPEPDALALTCCQPTMGRTEKRSRVPSARAARDLQGPRRPA